MLNTCSSAAEGLFLENVNQVTNTHYYSVNYCSHENYGQ